MRAVKTILLAMILLVSSGCAVMAAAPENEEKAESGYIKITAQESNLPIRIGCENINGMWNPFWAETDGDRRAAELTSQSLLTVDRSGAVLYKAANGEMSAFNGLNYTYKGMADLNVNIRDDGSAVYTWTLADNIKFSDGTPVTADDIVFSYYLCCDPSYNGIYKVYSLPVRGLESYLTGADEEKYEKYRLMAEMYMETPSTTPDENESWFYNVALKNAWIEECAHIVDYCRGFIDTKSEATGCTPDEIRASDGLTTAFAMYLWGIGSFTQEGFAINDELYDPNSITLEHFYEASKNLYGDAKNFFNLEAVGDERDSIITDAIRRFIRHMNEDDQDPVKSISGIEKLNDKTVSITLESYKAADIFTLDIAVLPLHHFRTYTYAPELGYFGFEPGNTDAVKALAASAPVTGPYVVTAYDGVTVELYANCFYHTEPKTRNIQLITSHSGYKGVEMGEYDLYFDEFEPTNNLIYMTCEGAGYGYIGISAENVKVGGNADSEQSKALRRALSVIINSFRDETDFYYNGGSIPASRQLSCDSWAYTGEGPVYNLEDALCTAAGLLKEAGYVWDIKEGRFTKAPAGASLEYEILIPGSGTGSHPSYKVAKKAAETLKRLGLTLRINDLSNPNELLAALERGEQELWAAAWNGTAAPDLYQLYHSENIPPFGTELNYSRIADETLDKLLSAARVSTDITLRRENYAKCMDIIDDWGVETPLYRRLYALYIGRRIEPETVLPFTSYRSWTEDAAELALKN